jgi:hypothetical protein
MTASLLDPDWQAREAATWKKHSRAQNWTSSLALLALVLLGVCGVLVGNRVAEKALARQATQDVWQRQQLEATQALVEEVRKLREILEERR